MEKRLTKSKEPLTGTVHIPGDKSISHRAVIFGSLAKGTTHITHFLNGEDCQRTIEIFRSFGVQIEQEDSNVVIKSEGVESFREPLVPLYFGNSGTTARLLLGLLTAFPFHTVVYGDLHLTKRPMDRVITPLKQMGANLDGRKDGLYLPLSIRGNALQSITYESPVKSAQVKSAILLAGLFAEGQTTVVEGTKTRNHTENMLEAFGADITFQENAISIQKGKSLRATDVQVPGDISSAAFILVAAAIVPGSSVTIKDAGLNKTRAGILTVLEQMGSRFTITNEKVTGGESTGDITIHHHPLQGITIDGDIIPTLIDEIPIIALLATQAKGQTVIKDAEELRVKETDRIQAVVEVLQALGASVAETKDGMIIEGETALKGNFIKGYHDHRMAMMGAIASLIAEGETTIDDVSSINISYPSFFDDVVCLSKKK